MSYDVFYVFKRRTLRVLLGFSAIFHGYFFQTFERWPGESPKEVPGAQISNRPRPAIPDCATYHDDSNANTTIRQL